MSAGQRDLVSLIADVARTPGWDVDDNGTHWLIRGGTDEPAPPYRVRQPTRVTPRHLANITRRLRVMGWTPELAAAARERARRLRLAHDRRPRSAA